MVRTTRHTLRPRPLPVRRKVGVQVVLALGGLHEDEANPIASSRREVYILLVAGHVDPLDRQHAGPVHAPMRTIVALDRAIDAAAPRTGGNQQ